METTSEVRQKEPLNSFWLKDRDLRTFVQSNTYQKLKPESVKLFLTLLSYGSPDKDFVYPSQQQLIEHMGGVGYKKLMSAINDLETNGLIEYQQGNGRLNSVFSFRNDYDQSRFYPSKQLKKKVVTFPDKKEKAGLVNQKTQGMPKGKPHNNKTNSMKQEFQVSNNKTEAAITPTLPLSRSVVVHFKDPVLEKDFITWCSKECHLSEIVSTEILKLKPIGETEMTIIKQEWMKQKHRVKNPSGWIRRFLDGSIDLSPMVSDEKEKQKKRDEMKRLNESLAERQKKESETLQNETEKKIEEFKQKNPTIFDELWQRTTSILKMKGYKETDDLWDGLFSFHLLRFMQC